jgi:hypothetical protein
LDGRIPEEEWTGKKINYYFLKTFGCEAFFHIDKEYRTKLEAKSKKCTFIQGVPEGIVNQGDAKVFGWKGASIET